MNENILAPINKCESLINTAFELYKSIDILCEHRIETYISDNNKRQRTVIYNNQGIALSACYYELKSGFVIYGHTAKQFRRRGIYKQLKGFINVGRHKQLPELWSQFQSDDYIAAFGKQ